MTELERLLKESLSQTEQLLRNNQIAHSQTLQHHSRELKNLKSAVSTLQAEQAALTGHLTRLSCCVRELAALVEAAERAVARQVERVRERQRSVGRAWDDDAHALPDKESAMSSPRFPTVAALELWTLCRYTPQLPRIRERREGMTIATA